MSLKLRTIIGNLPGVGRYLYPYKNNYSIFKDDSQFYSKGFTKPLSKFSRAKIIVVGLPKSGNVWLQNLIAESLDMDKINIKDKGKRGVAMTHTPFNRSYLYRKDFARGVYLMRDIRDMVVSYYHYSKTEEYHRPYTDPFCHYEHIDDFYFEYFLNIIVPRYDWFNHAQTFINKGLPVVKYERLWDDPEKELNLMFRKLGLSVDQEKIAAAIRENELKKLAKSGKEADVSIPKSHFRKGGYGNYKETLSEKVLADINIRFRDYILAFGYELDH
ncbi:MAG: sulfotransferase domain-containing protein [Flavobacteriales bacterium]|nr:sulfotransferase domain-containing protein [Flavobacteriales bacterium]